MVALSEKLVLAKTRAASLADVRNLNMWGNELTDVSIVERMPNVEVLSLSVNKIFSLQEFGKCPNLQELYLRKNEVADLAEIRHLVKLPNLRVLWLNDNPCAEVPNYRQIVIRTLAKLTKLDNADITVEERAASERVPLPFKLDVDVKRGSPPEVSTPGATAGSREAAPKAAADRQQKQQDGANGRVRQKEASSNVLYAVMALLNELDEDGLNIVRIEVEQKLGLLNAG